MYCQMIRVISSPSSSTTGLATLILGMPPISLPMLIGPRRYLALPSARLPVRSRRLAAGEAAGWRAVSGPSRSREHQDRGHDARTQNRQGQDIEHTAARD